jgi:hypothetical protein
MALRAEDFERIVIIQLTLSYSSMLEAGLSTNST